MGRYRHPSSKVEASKRTKARHGPNPPPNYYESEEEEEIEEIPKAPRARRGGRRPGKELAQSQYTPHPQQPRLAPYMMRSMPVPRASARPNPRARGAAYEICPRTRDRLAVEFGPDQRNHPYCPKMRSPGVIEGFAISATRDYFKQSITVKNQRAIDPYRYRKSEGLEQRFWCDFHRDFYVSVMLRNKDQPIVPMKCIDWEYFENMNDPSVNAVIGKFEEYKLRDLMASTTTVTLKSYASSIVPSTTVREMPPSIGLLRGSTTFWIT
jgi:hypothetical protein